MSRCSQVLFLPLGVAPTPAPAYYGGAVAAMQHRGSNAAGVAVRRQRAHARAQQNTSITFTRGMVVKLNINININIRGFTLKTPTLPLVYPLIVQGTNLPLLPTYANHRVKIIQ